MRNLTIIAMAATITAAPVAASAQGRLELLPGSSLRIDGTSTLHAWTCKTTDLQASFELGSGEKVLGVGALAKADVDVPVKSLKCGHDKMDNNMYKALKASEFSTIAYRLERYELLPGATKDTATIRTVASLTIAGVTKQVSMDVVGRRDNGQVAGVGRVQLLMTDFGIKPPVVMAGLLKTGNQITVAFDVRASLTPVVAAAWDAAVAGSR